MNPVLEQIYATVLPSAPFVIAAYALMWAALLVYVVYAAVRMRRVESQVSALEEALENGTPRREDGQGAPAEGQVHDATERILKKDGREDGRD